MPFSTPVTTILLLLMVNSVSTQLNSSKNNSTAPLSDFDANVTKCVHLLNPETRGDCQKYGKFCCFLSSTGLESKTSCFPTNYSTLAKTFSFTQNENVFKLDCRNEFLVVRWLAISLLILFLFQ